MADATWTLIPFLDLWGMTQQTCEDILAQSAPTRILLINQGSSEEVSAQARQYADQHHPRVLLWSFHPALPSLSAAWNRGLRFCWELGAEEVWVCNSDLRLDPDTLESLQRARTAMHPLFVSGVGVREDSWPPPNKDWLFGLREALIRGDTFGGASRGGPDFSCFLLSREGHEKYPFDEGFVPCYGEDVDMHRRYLLGGDGHRIYSLNVPFLHIQGGSRTINQSAEARARFERVAQIGRQHYRAKWGGEPNREIWKTPFGEKGDDPLLLNASDRDLAVWQWIRTLPATTPELQQWYRDHPLVDLDGSEADRG